MIKIKPNIYRKILEGIELQTIYLKSFEGKINREAIPKEAIARISSKADFRVTTENRVGISQKWDIIGKDKSTKSEFITISVTYAVILHSKNEFKKDFFEIYEKTSLTLNVWPFVREFVNNMTARMNIPPLTLPLLKFAQKSRPKSAN